MFALKHRKVLEGTWTLILYCWFSEPPFHCWVWDWRCSLDDLETSSVSLLPCDLLYCFVCLGGFACVTASIWSRVVAISMLLLWSGSKFQQELQAKRILEDKCWKHMSELGQISRQSQSYTAIIQRFWAMTSKHDQNGSIWDQCGKAEFGLVAWLSCFDVVLLTIADCLLTMNLPDHESAVSRSFLHLLFHKRCDLGVITDLSGVAIARLRPCSTFFLTTVHFLSFFGAGCQGCLLHRPSRASVYWWQRPKIACDCDCKKITTQVSLRFFTLRIAGEDWASRAKSWPATRPLRPNYPSVARRQSRLILYSGRIGNMNNIRHGLWGMKQCHVLWAALPAHLVVLLLVSQKPNLVVQNLIV